MLRLLPQPGKLTAQLRGVEPFRVSAALQLPLLGDRVTLGRNLFLDRVKLLLEFRNFRNPRPDGFLRGLKLVLHVHQMLTQLMAQPQLVKHRLWKVLRPPVVDSVRIHASCHGVPLDVFGSSCRV